MAGVRCPILVGRAAELGELTELVAAASGGAGGTAFLVGEAGIGKSRLLTAVADIARSRGMVVLRGRASPSPAPAPYRPLAEALLSVLRGRAPEADPALAPYASALGALAPGLFAVEVEREPSVVLLGEAVLAVVQRYASAAGAVLILEDLQWAGAETLDVVDYLSGTLESTAIALCASVRSGEPSAAEQLAHGVSARRGGSLIALRRMDADRVKAVITASLGTPAVPEQLSEVVREASGGVPFLVEELLASLIDSGAMWQDGDRWHIARTLPALVPSSFAVLIAERLAALDPVARRVIVTAAVLGERFDWRLVGRVTGLDDETIVEALRDAVAAQLVDETNEPAPRFTFRHGLSRTAVLETLLGPERELLARAALDVLGDADDPEQLELVADLAVLARSEVAVRALIRAAGAAAERGACLSAIRSADLAVGLAATQQDVIDAREVLLAACVAAGDTTRAAEVGRTLLTELDRRGDAALTAAVHRQLASAAVHATDWSRAEDHMERADRLDPPVDAAAGARVDVLRAAVALGRHDARAAAVHAQRAGDAARAIGEERLETEALLLLGRAHRVLDVDAARADFATALDLARRSGSQLLLARAAHEMATIDVLTAGPARRLEDARALAVAGGAVALTAIIDTHLAIVHGLHFDLDASRAAADRAVDATRRYELGLLAPTSTIAPGMCAAMSGRRDEAVALFARALPSMDAEIEATGRGHILAIAALSSEDRGTAGEQLERAAVLAPAFSGVARAPHCGIRALLLAVEASAGAADVVDRLAADPAVVGVARHLTDLARAALDGRAGDGDGATRRAERAVDALAATPWYRAMGERLVSEAALADGWGTPATWLRDALAFFETATIPDPADACRRLLRAAGAPMPRPPARDDHPQLARAGITSREAEVLALVAHGLSNRDVADRLVLSVRTVEKHVERLMTKTATTNRSQLAAYAVRLETAATPPSP